MGAQELEKAALQSAENDMRVAVDYVAEQGPVFRPWRARQRLLDVGRRRAVADVGFVERPG
jgi:hypothetical protein